MAVPQSSMQTCQRPRVSAAKDSLCTSAPVHNMQRVPPCVDFAPLPRNSCRAGSCPGTCAGTSLSVQLAWLQ
eukprot:10481256-Alexandrium_andersonii.AAC.1